MKKIEILSEFFRILSDLKFTGWVRFYGRKMFITQGQGIERSSPKYMNEYNKINNSRINELRRDRYNDRLKQGLCPKCGKKPKIGHKLCVKHSKHGVSKNGRKNKN